MGCSPWGREESDMTERLTQTQANKIIYLVTSLYFCAFLNFSWVTHDFPESFLI